ncbi:hypothetical protein H696_01467 [Fonticula alba]|uniref:GIT Spa2 homology (SHD) domain-containing protein n=1 Tax=Fonticula alba TaxID=691883 RepID=A0A058ZDQ7_FONAL|nr:hypothetical protein H696_01467 [Fonticula alba]KCV72058.1 hypothetical protein H696_01467 [Fonticula alba]|eukprot:XP_009493636.1 hypothetical protein H696_01467 [Fonticula alba]
MMVPHQCFREFETYLSAYLQASRPSTSQQSNARHRLTLLSTVQFQELAEDLLNELRLRRASRDPNERPPPPDDTQGFQHKRIDARMKLSTLPEHRFRDLVCDIYFELIRRFPDSKAMSPSPTASTPLPADDASSSMKELDIMFTNMNVATTAPMGALSPTLNGVPTPPVVAASPATAGLPPSPRSIAPPPGASPSSGMAGAPNAGGPAFDMLPPRVTAHSGHFPSPGGPASGQAPTPLPAAPPADDPFPEPTPGRATRDELPETLIFTADSESDHASQAAPAGTMAHASRQPSVSSHPRASANSANSSFSDLSALQPEPVQAADGAARGAGPPGPENAGGRDGRTVTAARSAPRRLWTGALRSVRAFSSDTNESPEAFDQRWSEFFTNAPDIEEVHRGLTNLFSHDVIPGSKILESALYACRRLNDFPTSVRILGALEGKLRKEKPKYEAYLVELGPVMAKLGVPSPAEIRN